MKFDVHLRSGAVITIDGRGDSLKELLSTLPSNYDSITDDHAWVRWSAIDAITEHLDIDEPIPLVPAEIPPQ